MSMFDQWLGRAPSAPTETFKSEFGSITGGGMSNTLLGPAGIGVGIGTALSNQLAAQQMQNLGGVPPIYRGDKYRRTTFNVQEISNGYTVVVGEETYYCEDLAAVGARVSTVLATQVLAK